MTRDINMYVTFNIDGERCGFCIDNVISIEKIQEITRLPNGPDYIEGVINLRGEVIALINLRKKLGLAYKELDNDTRIIITTYEDMSAGIIVDSSSEVIEISDDDIDNPPMAENNPNLKYIQGIGKIDQGIITILKLSEIFNK